MAKITWCEAEPRVFEVERIEDSQIDDLFYQEDEIGEMRHYAFMIECGLEEEDWGGPEVEPVRWPGDGKGAHKPVVEKKKPELRRLPTRTRSTDDLDVIKAKEEEEEPVKKEPPARRKLVATKSGTLHNMRAAAAKKDKDDDKEAAPEKKAPRVRPAPGRRKITASKSGSMHQLRQRRAQIAAKEEEEKKATDGTSAGSSGRSPPGRRKLVATKSGTLHGMRKKAQDVAKMASTAAATSITDAPGDSSPAKPVRRRVKASSSTSGDKEDEDSGPSRISPKRTSLTKTRSGSGLKRASRTKGSSSDSKNLNDSASSLNNSSSNLNNSSSSITRSPGSYKMKIKDAKPKEPMRQISIDDSDKDDNSNDSASVSIGSDDDEPKKPVKPKVTSKVSKSGRSRITIVKDSAKYTTPASPMKSPETVSPTKRNWTPNGTAKSRIKVTKEDIAPPSVSEGKADAPVRRTSTSKESVKESMKAFKTGNKSASELLKQFQVKKSKDSADLPPAFAAMNSTSRTRVRPKGAGSAPKKAQSMIVGGTKKFGKKDDDDNLPPAFRQLRSKAG